MSQGRYIGLSDVDPEKATAVFSFMVGEDNKYKAVRMDLLTGKALSPETPKSVPAGDNDTRPSPSGKLLLRDNSWEGKGVALESSEGKVITELKGPVFGRASTIQWAQSDAHILYDISTSNETSDVKAGLYLYTIDDGKSRLLVEGEIMQISWSPDKRLMCCLQAPDDSRDLAGTLRNRFGKLHVFDASQDFALVCAGGDLIGEYKPSPNCRRIAFRERVKDESGDYSNRSLGFIDLKSGEIKRLAVNRRDFGFEWAGDDHLALLSYDKYAAPSLSLISLDGDTRLLARPASSGTRIQACLPDRQRVFFSTWTHEEGPYELWAVEPGSKPVRLFPKGGR